MTSFELFVAADLYGNKVNLELHFPTVPSIAEVTRVTESTFAVEATTLRPEGYPLQAFRLSRMLIYDDSHERWVELSHTHQLVDGAQLYAFQRESFHHMETQKPIPPARPPTSRAGGGRVPSIVADNFPSRLPSSSTVGGPAGGPVRQSIHVSPTRVQRGGATNLSSIHEATAATTPPRIVPSSGFISHEEKLRVIFDEMDLNQNRVVEMDEWKRTLRVLGIDFTPATTMDLFHKADANGDGVLSVQEFLNFGAMYPTLMDCMFFRAKDYWDTYAKKQSIQALNELLGELREKERAIRADALEVQKDVETQENRLEQAERAVQENIAREKDTRTRIFEVQRETERVQKERLDREHEVEACREKEHQRHTALAEAQQDVHRIEQRVLHQEDELGKAQERERQLQILLVEAQREIERQAKLVQNAQSDLGQAREREQHANGLFLEVQRELQRFMERLAQAEHDVAAKFEQERELEALQLEMQRGTARACHQRDEEERVLAAQREREQQRVRAQNEAMAAVEEHERRLKLLEQELYEVLERKAQTEQQEKPLLEQEVRLREQRDSLEEKENRLKSEVAQFFDVNQRMRASSAASRHPPSMASGIDTTPVCTSSSLYPRAQNTSYVATTSVSSHHHSNSTGAALGNTHQNHYHRTLHTSA